MKRRNILPHSSPLLSLYSRLKQLNVSVTESLAAVLNLFKKIWELCRNQDLSMNNSTCSAAHIPCCGYSSYLSLRVVIWPSRFSLYYLRLQSGRQLMCKLLKRLRQLQLTRGRSLHLNASWLAHVRWGQGHTTARQASLHYSSVHLILLEREKLVRNPSRQGKITTVDTRWWKKISYD